ncbi:alpha/beta hydrolase [Pseudonocardia sp. P1]
MGLRGRPADEHGGIVTGGRTEQGPAVLLLPGGAAACEGFFPGMPEGLADDPGCRVIVHDRPGTGTSTEDGTLAGAAAHLAALVGELGRGPVVVVGQSLGGAVATLLARDHPEVVAGLVLLDPTPINDPAACARLERVMGVVATVTAVPPVRGLLAGLLRATMARERRRLRLRPDCAAAHERIAGSDIRVLARAVRGLAALSAGLREADLPRVPSVVVTADRAETDAVHRAHARLADAFGGTLVSWPGSTHNPQLDHPDETLAVVRELAGRVATGR